MPNNCFKFLVSVPLMDFGTRNLKCWVCEPSGFVLFLLQRVVSRDAESRGLRRFSRYSKTGQVDRTAEGSKLALSQT